MTNTSDPYDLAGQVLDGQFRVDRPIGEGGFSVVYRGHHIGLDEPVAIKCLKLQAQLGSALVEAFVQRFRDESKIHYRLSRGSLHIARTIAAGTTMAPATGALVPYMVLEWLEGFTLSAELRARRQRGEQGRTLAEVIRMLDPVADAMAFAHAQGVVHRDLNPSNVFVAHDRDGRPRLKVLDFGVAKVISDHALSLGPRVATLGLIRMFTPAYGAPEQFQESLGPVRPYTDVYAFALMVVELLTDRTPIDGEHLGEIADRVLDPDHRPTPRAFGVPLGNAVEQVMAKALSVNPDDRPGDVGELWGMLKNAASRDSSAPSQEVSAPGRPPPNDKKARDSADDARRASSRPPPSPGVRRSDPDQPGRYGYVSVRPPRPGSMPPSTLKGNAEIPPDTVPEPSAAAAAAMSPPVVPPIAPPRMPTFSEPVQPVAVTTTPYVPADGFSAGAAQSSPIRPLQQRATVKLGSVEASSLNATAVSPSGSPPISSNKRPSVPPAANSSGSVPAPAGASTVPTARSASGHPSSPVLAPIVPPSAPSGPPRFRAPIPMPNTPVTPPAPVPAAPSFAGTLALRSSPSPPAPSAPVIPSEPRTAPIPTGAPDRSTGATAFAATLQLPPARDSGALEGPRSEDGRLEEDPPSSTGAGNRLPAAMFIVLGITVALVVVAFLADKLLR